MTTYTVLMLYPSYVTDSNDETYLTCIHAGSVPEAKTLAQKEAAQDNLIDDWDDFIVLYVAEGWHPDVKDQR